MITTTASFNMITTTQKTKNCRSGYTLAELMIAMSIALVVVAISTGSMIFISQWYFGLGNYLQMNQQSRIALEWIGRDLRMSSAVVVTSDEDITLTIPTGGGANRTVRYWWSDDQSSFMRTESGTETIMLDSVREVQFAFFNALGVETDRAVDIKMIQLNAELQRRVRATTNTNYVISARFTMRNKIIGS
jgi:prepilin-type N-terminal cleavage/methylation domain-containing protein